MLSTLSIQNYILIKELETDFRKGFTTVTGETGTGKSIILGALGLIMGNRADASTLLDNEKKCIIEGVFSIGKYKLQGFFRKNELDWDEQAILRREIAPNGKSRAFINDTPVNLNVLKDLGEKLLDIHSQHQTLQISAPGFQIGLLDANIDHKELLEEYSGAYKTYRKQERSLNELRENEARSKKEYDYNLFQLNEIDSAQILPGEMERLEGELSLLSHAETIQYNLQQAGFMLSEDEQSIMNRLREVKKALTAIATFDPRLKSLEERLGSLLIEGKDITGDIDEFLNSVSVDNERMADVSARMQVLNQLLTKHQFRSEAELLAYAEDLRARVNTVETIVDEIQALEKEKELLKLRLGNMADKISAGRQKAVPVLEKSLVTLLKQVGIPEAQVVIKMDKRENFTENGMDQVSILFSANKGSRPDSVENVASGGELSRLMLCFKYVLADSVFLPTIIFDEIDTGVSGEVALRVGTMIKKLSARHQVICITHLPQVAAMGDQQYLVFKKTGKDFTQTNIRELSPADRIDEIAKMLAGNKPSQVAVESARELLKV